MPEFDICLTRKEKRKERRISKLTNTGRAEPDPSACHLHVHNGPPFVVLVNSCVLKVHLETKAQCRAERKRATEAKGWRLEAE